jgi:hypothetical protein
MGVNHFDRVYEIFKFISEKLRNNHPHLGVGLYKLEDSHKGPCLYTRQIPLDSLYLRSSLNDRGLILTFPIEVFSGAINNFKKANIEEIEKTKKKLKNIQKILGGTDDCWDEIYADLDKIISFSWENFLEKENSKK